MNRLQKKCMIVSGGIHLLLAVILIFGPGFLSLRSHENAPPVMTAVPFATVEAALYGGGDKSVKMPTAEGSSPESPATTPVVVPSTPVTPPVEVPQPAIERVQPRQPEKELPPVAKDPPRVKSPVVDPAPVKPSPRKARDIDVDLTVKTSSTADIKAKQQAEANAAALARAKEQQRIASLLGRATAGIRGGVSGSTEIRMQGIGTGGVSYGNIQSAIITKYKQEWKVPDSAPDLTVSVSITLARDGNVVSARITDRSGNVELDSSVQKTLDRVRFVAPLPDGETQETRTFNFGFNPDMKLSE